MIRLSVVVPYTHRDQQFEATLVSILENVPAESEVVVVSDGSYSDPYAIGDEVRIVEMPKETSLLELMNCGSREADGEILHFVLPGLRVQPGWTKAAVAQFANPRVASVSPGILESQRASRACAGVSYRGHGKRIVAECSAKRMSDRRVSAPVFGPTLWAGFYRRSFFELSGGFDSRLPVSVADIDLGLTLSAMGLNCVFEPASLLTCDGPNLFQVSAIAEGQGEEQLFWKHASERGNPGTARRLLATMSELLSTSPLRGILKLIGRLTIRVNAARRSDPAYQTHIHESSKVVECLIKQAERRHQDAPQRPAYRRAA